MLNGSKKKSQNEKASLPRMAKKKIVIYVVISFCMLLLAGAALFVRSNINQKVALREEDNAEYQQALSEVESLSKSCADKEVLVKKNSGSISEKIVDEQTLYSYIANACNKFDLTIGFVRAGDFTNVNGVATQHYKMMFIGSDSNLKLMLDSMDTLPSAYSITSMSYRVETDEDWIKRAIDSKTTYGWYNNAEQGLIESEQMQYKTLADVLSYDSYSLYLDIAFVSTQ